MITSLLKRDGGEATNRLWYVFSHDSGSIQRPSLLTNGGRLANERSGCCTNISKRHCRANSGQNQSLSPSFSWQSNFRKSGSRPQCTGISVQFLLKFQLNWRLICIFKLLNWFLGCKKYQTCLIIVRILYGYFSDKNTAIIIMRPLNWYFSDMRYQKR